MEEHIRLRLSLGLVFGLPTTERTGGSTKGNAPLCSPKTSVSTPLHLPLSTRLGEISLSLGVPSKPFFGPFGALGAPREALCSPATSPKFSKRCPYGARLAPATGGAPATFSAAAARPPQQSSRRAPGGGFNPRPAPLFLLPAGGRVASQSHRFYSPMPPLPFSLRSNPRALDRPSGMQPREGAVPTRFRCGENLST